MIKDIDGYDISDDTQATYNRLKYKKSLKSNKSNYKIQKKSILITIGRLRRQICFLSYKERLFK